METDHRLVLFNARVYAHAFSRTPDEAIAIDRGVVQAIGSTGELRQQLAGQWTWIDLQGFTVLPGLTDSHIHLEHYGFALQKVNCETKTLAECLNRISEKLAVTPAGSWVLGHGWNQNEWAGGFPTAAELDKLSTLHPIYLTAKSLHAAWSNTAALHAAGITANTSDPLDGKIQRDAAGNPTGILFESAMGLIEHSMPEPAVEDSSIAIHAAQSELLRMGVTGVHDFDRRRCFVALQKLNEEHRLHLRVIKSIPLELLEDTIALGLRSGFGNEWLRIGSLKAFADGALGPRTAAMIQPYLGEPGNRGILMLDEEELLVIGRKATTNGISMAVHAIGDAANHALLNAYAQLRNFEVLNHLPHLRHRIEHVQIIHPQDVSRLAELHIIASMQPIHAISDMDMADLYWGDRARLSYAWQSQQKLGAVLAFGSDAPVDSPNPFLGIHAAVTRKKEGRASGWYPEECVDLSTALAAYTTGAAFTSGTEKFTGQLKPGFYADLIVLPRDPFTIDSDEIKTLQPAKTMVGGHWVYQS